MYINKADATTFSIPGGTQGAIYPDHPNKEMTVAVVEMDGVYPEKGFSINTRCTETIYMISGSFVLNANGQEHHLNPGDMFMILPNTKYSIAGTGTAMDVITPAWDKSQNSIVE